MDLQLKNKTALVTGGSEGIGKGIALLLAREGVDVAICSRRKDALEAAAAQVAQGTGGSEGIGKGIALLLAREGVDVAICSRRKDALEAAAAEIAEATGRK